MTYGNEKLIGEGIKLALDEGLVKRDELFITSKLWNNDRTPELIASAIQQTLSDLQLSYLDLYLIHWPINWKKGPDGETIRVDGIPVKDTTLTIPQVYQEMEKLVDAGQVKSLGVSNFSIEEIEDVWNVARVKPTINQVESHPLWNQFELENGMKKYKMILTAYTPFAWKTPEGMVPLLSRPEILAASEKHGKAPTQIVLRWQIQHGRVVIPKASSKERLAQNFNIFDFELDEEDMKSLDNLQPQARHSKHFGFRCVKDYFFPNN